MRYGYCRYPRKVLTGTVSRAYGWEKKGPVPKTQQTSISLGTAIFLGLIPIVYLFLFH